MEVAIVVIAILKYVLCGNELPQQTASSDQEVKSALVARGGNSPYDLAVLPSELYSSSSDATVP